MLYKWVLKSLLYCSLTHQIGMIYLKFLCKIINKRTSRKLCVFSVESLHLIVSTSPSALPPLGYSAFFGILYFIPFLLFHTHTHTHSYIHTHTCTHTHTHSYTPTHDCTHTHSHTCTRTYTHTNKYSLPLRKPLWYRMFYNILSVCVSVCKYYVFLVFIHET